MGAWETVNDVGPEFASATLSSTVSSAATGRRILLLSFGAVDEGVFGLDSSSSSESKALDRRPIDDIVNFSGGLDSPGCVDHLGRCGILAFGKVAGNAKSVTN